MRHRRRQSLRDRCEVICPPLFEMDGKISLKNFLEIFEQYFYKKYNGNEYDQTQLLSGFLKDDL